MEDISQAFDNPETNNFGISRSWISSIPFARSPASMGQLRFGVLTDVYTTSNSYWFLITYSPDSVSQTILRCDLYGIKGNNPRTLESAKQSLRKQTEATVVKFEQTYKKLAYSNDNLSYCTGLLNLNIRWCRIANSRQTSKRKLLNSLMHISNSRKPKVRRSGQLRCSSAEAPLSCRQKGVSPSLFA